MTNGSSEPIGIQKPPMKKLAMPLLLVVLLTNCCSETNKQNQARVSLFEIQNLTDEEYPDNPDIGFRSSNYRNNLFHKGKITNTKNPFVWNLEFHTHTNDTIRLKKINLSEFIPTIPRHIKSEEYLSYISCISQEWNRNQVKFVKGEFRSTMPDIVRVDLARNCLNAYLWEIILFKEENNETVPYAQGWFNFPNHLYAQLFDKKNNINFSVYKKPMENWTDPENQKINFSALRTITDTLLVRFQDLSDTMYPLDGARKRKYKEIIYPATFSTMRDLQSDSTSFATFTPPGFYNKKDPRKTELGRIFNLSKINVHKTLSPISKETVYEIVLKFIHKSTNIETNLILGGIDFDRIPVLSEEHANEGWKNPMGIGNHSFYESYSQHINQKSENSPYYGLLTDENDNWLDSHKIGIDGPIFHFTDPEKKSLQLWLLSFERHALVGHYSIQMEQ